MGVIDRMLAKRDQRIREATAGEIMKAVVPAALTPQASPDLAVLLARSQSTRLGNPFGPGIPLIPTAIDLDPDGSPGAPRLTEYLPGWNLRFQDRVAEWNVLRRAAENLQIVRRCVDEVTTVMSSRDWSWTLSDDVITEIMADQEVSHSKANKIGREKYGNELDRMRQFWEHPYPGLDLDMVDWIKEALWQVLVYDGLNVYPQMTLGGDVVGFDIIDAPTIKILRDDRGGIPRPPEPAFQQILYGFPRSDLLSAPDGTSDADFYSGAGRNGEFRTSQLANFRRSQRTFTPYGYSPVEECLPWAYLWAERYRWNAAQYRAGTMPSAFMKTSGEVIDDKNMQVWIQTISDWLRGNTDERQGMTPLPAGMDPVFAPTVEQRYKVDLDEFVIKQNAAIFGIAPTRLGIIPHTGLGGKGQQQGESDQQDVASLQPLEKDLVRFVNALSRRFLRIDRSITAVCQGGDSDDRALQQAQAAQTALFSGRRTLNDMRAEDGEPDYENPRADEPFFMTATGPVYLCDLTPIDEFDSLGKVDPNDPTGAPPDEASPRAPQAAPQGQEGQADHPLGAGAPQAHVQAGPQGAAPHGEVQVGAGAGEAHAAEVVAFRKYAAKTWRPERWRDFNFEHVDPETAEALNAEARKAHGVATPVPFSAR